MIKRQLSAILFWSVISAAFIGPGTVTTAASAGTAYGIDLIWVLMLSMIACIVLQVNVTKLTIASNKTIGELLILYIKNLPPIPVVLGLSIVFGCMAYQAGNLLGATLALSLLVHLDQRWIILLIVLLASLMLWFGSIRIVVKLLGSIVALMGVVFIVIAMSVDYNFSDILTRSLIPKIPAGAELLVMGLIGTTIVPYNLFLGSGLSKGQKLTESTIGLTLAIVVGGIISMAILMVGTLVSEPFDFGKLSDSLTQRIGGWANLLLAVGLFSAGFTSSMTAPIAAVFTMQSVLPKHKGLRSRNSISYRLIWILVMSAGLIFGMLDVKPIPAIILAQAINGVILPFIATFILYIIAVGAGNSKRRIHLNTLILTLVVTLIVMIGAFNLLKLLVDPGLNLIYIAFSIGVLTTGITLLLARVRRSDWS